MTELTFNDPCVLFSLRRESGAFRQEFRPQLRFTGAPCWASFCAPRDLPLLQVLVLETGVGQEQTEAALQWVLGSPVLENVPYRPKVVLSAGFAGALQDGLHVGDIILATEVVSSEGERWTASWPGQLPPGGWQPPLHRGRLLTVPQLVTSPEEKRELGRRQEAVAADMETAVVARLCSRRGVPFGCVRAISDDLHTPLSPRLVSVLRGGRVSPLRLVLALLASPRLAGEMGRLARNTRRAAEQLGTALGELLTLTLPGGLDS
jgi:hypothetical protein